MSVSHTQADQSLPTNATIGNVKYDNPLRRGQSSARFVSRYPRP
ncbi:hypothetical protein ACS15_3089 [Ralstonia insidiosa]|uniref:Uncharacterized protein n=1 Tax=Ralstonia insidiosa TaxID=190721 RepID=A0AAC9BFT6_9RALS|nr:hypothetical protein ACS15_3089 [Ralstonia insidiosa]